MIESETEVADALEDMCLMAKPIYTSEQLRQLVRDILNSWAYYRPDEVRAAMHYMRNFRELHYGNKTGVTGAGEHILGVFPAYLANALVAELNDPHWMQNNPKLIGIIFDEFEVGRLAYWEGRGQGANRVTLCAGDR